VSEQSDAESLRPPRGLAIGRKVKALLLSVCPWVVGGRAESRSCEHQVWMRLILWPPSSKWAAKGGALVGRKLKL
jgi:hypothetical protein